MWCHHYVRVIQSLENRYILPRTKWIDMLIRNEISLYHIFGICRCPSIGCCDVKKYIQHIETLNKITSSKK